MRYPKDVEIWEHAPGRKLAEVVIRIKNVKGALASCSRTISDLDVNMLTGFVTAPSKSRTATLSFFADITDSQGGLSELKKKLQSLDVIESVDTIAAEDGFMVDKQHFPVQWAGRKAVVMRAEALNEMLNRLWTVFGSGAVTIIDQMAEAMGRHSAKEIIEDFGARFAAEQLDELLSTYSALGYADVSIERSKPSDFPFVINAKELFECEANAKQGLPRKSSFFRAHLKGFMAATFDKAFEVEEVQCLAEGDDVCSFRVALAEAAAPKIPTRLAERAPN
jgi:predicted hydrocarbon binding protein